MCGIGTENIGSECNCLDPEWHWEAAGWVGHLSSKPTFWERPFEGRLFPEEIKSYLAVAAAARAPMARRI